MGLRHIHVGVRSERASSPYLSTIRVEWEEVGGTARGIYLTREEAIETCVRILAMVSLLDPMDTSEIDKMVERVDRG